ncbi:MAG: L-threonylcarbamoyladenylate synthase [Candidatus Micrarchaeia archaeon]|jgi:tRNA threonylcarbamoyl adenosine modification protein (Sua5/YciO/YrdC/YwlC family)
MQIKNNDDYKTALELASNIILNGGIILYPTDTVYGLGCNGLNLKAVEKINKIKQITEFKPISALFGHIEIAKQYCNINEEQEKILKKYLPGPYTFILPLKKAIPLSNNNTLGIRIPNNKFCIDLGKLLKIPIASTSANLTGEKPPINISEVTIKKKVDLIIDQGECNEKESSTIVDLINNKIIRQGKAEFKF